MRAYLDSSALVKRVVEEAESAALEDHLGGRASAGGVLVASSLASVEVARAVRRLPGLSDHGADALAREALAGVAESRISTGVVALARRVGPRDLRAMDALHLATALLLDVDVVLTYDERLAGAAAAAGLVVLAPA